MGGYFDPSSNSTSQVISDLRDQVINTVQKHTFTEWNSLYKLMNESSKTQ